jgi:hypothetical protein
MFENDAVCEVEALKWPAVGWKTSEFVFPAGMAF